MTERWENAKETLHDTSENNRMVTLLIGGQEEVGIELKALDPYVAPSQVA